MSNDALCRAKELSRSCLMKCSLTLVKHFFTTRAKNLKSYAWNWRKWYIWARWCKRKLKAWGQLLGCKNKIRKRNKQKKKTVFISTWTYIHSLFFRTNSLSLEMQYGDNEPLQSRWFPIYLTMRHRKNHISHYNPGDTYVDLYVCVQAYKIK